VKLGTTIPRDEPAKMNGIFNLDKALECLAGAGIRGCMTNPMGDESQWEAFTRDMDRARRAAGVEVLEYNTPSQIHVPSREMCAPSAEHIVHMLQLAESLDCLDVCAGVSGPNEINPHPWNRSPECHDLLKETCEIIARESARRNLKARLALEPIYTTLLWSPLALARFVDEIGSPNVQGHMDIVNCISFDNLYNHAEFIKDAFTILGDRIHSAHVKDVAPTQSYCPGVTECLVGDGVLDLLTYLRHLSRKPSAFPALIEHTHVTADILRSYGRVKSLADNIGIPVWC
jgi:sugar phosphate isomerase/epimerase